MSSNVPISNPQSKTAPTPQNTPLATGPLAAGLSRPTVPDIDEDDEGAPANTTQTQLLSSLVQGKLAGLIGKSSGYIESLPTAVKRNVEALKGVQTQYTAIQKEYKREMLELEAKYQQKYAPVFARRTAIVSGAATPTTEEIKLGEAESLKDDPAYEPLPAPSATETEKGIPEFWLTALRNHIGISELITDRDAPAIAHLTDITITHTLTPKPGFTLTFHFSPNDFFTDATLTKTYLYQDEIGYGGDYVYERAVGCTIHWKEDKDLTKSFEIKKQRNKNTNRTRLVRKAHPTDSFFNFFAPPVPPAEDALENGEIEEDDLEDLEERLELDYQIGEDLKERIIPRAVDYFTGKALEYEDMDDDEDFEDDDDEEDDDEEEDEDEEQSESEDEEVPARRRGAPARRGGRGGPTGGTNVDPQECKQQ